MRQTGAEVQSERLVQAERIRVEFGALVALRGVSFDLHAGDLVGLIGPNGAGKTTLLRVLAGLQPPTSGSARVMGHDVFHASDEVRGRVGFAPDSPPAYEELTINQFLRYIAEMHGVTGHEADERIGYWLDQVWLQEKRRERIKTLSRGMRQRVTIAQTLLPNPAVVLLDEPSSGLDPAGRIQLRQVIASLRDMGKAVIVSSHILADLEEYCTHIAIIEHGRLLRYSHVRDLGRDGGDRCSYRLTVAAEGDYSETLIAVDGISRVVRESEGYSFDFKRDGRAAAGLLRSLVERGVPVASFMPVKETLEDVYLRAGVRQVD